jgi:hypothetical protein
VVQTHLVARLLGVRLLKVDGVVQLAPARLESAPAPGITHAPTPTTGPAPALGGGLAHAARLLEDGDRRLR